MSNNIRIEEDLLGTREVPAEAYYGVHTLRAIENFYISNNKISDIPEFVRGMVMVKKAAALANKELQTIPKSVANAIIAACDEVLNNGKCMDQFPVDVYQGGAGTSVNMNTNEVLANIGLELMGHQKGEYQYLNPNDHVNKCQSTNDAYPTGFRVAVYASIVKLIDAINQLREGFERKAVEFQDILKMGRTQLQDAVPMTLGQEFRAFSILLKEEVKSIERTAELLLEVNLGATAIGTGLNTPKEYSPLAVKKLAEVTGFACVPAEDLIEATSDCGAYVMVHSALKRLAVKMSKICNDLRFTHVSADFRYCPGGKAAFVDGARTAAGLYLCTRDGADLYRTGSGRRRSGITVSGGAAAPLCVNRPCHRVHPACVVDVWPVHTTAPLLTANPADINE